MPKAKKVSKMAMTPEKFKELLAKAKAKTEAARLAKLADTVDSVELPSHIPATIDGINELVAPSAEPAEKENSKIGVARNVQLNTKQREFADLVLAGKSCVLIGAAGTGKTTSCRQTTREMIDSDNYGVLEVGTKVLKAGSPGIVVSSYTRKAVANIRRAVVPELKANTVTIHKLLEFEPVIYEIEDKDKPGFFKKTMRFEPKRTASNPLPASIKAIFLEESSMIPVDLFNLLMDACPHNPQLIFLGDIQQLPPVFGLAILGYKMVELPLVELTEVYRQALDSPIISLAWKLLGGNPLDFSAKTERFTTPEGKSRIRVPALEKLSWSSDSGSVKFQVWQKTLTVDHALIALRGQLIQWIETGYYKPNDDIILCPFNKAGTFSCIELNLMLNQYLGEKRNAVVHHVIAGFLEFYLAVGDRVLYDKEDCYITSIKPNPQYLGKKTLPPSTELNRDGTMRRTLTKSEAYLANQRAQAGDEEEFSLAEIESMMASAVDNVEERVQAASHIIHVRYAHNYEEGEAEDITEDEGEPDHILSSASEVNNLMGGYAITVHKSQGSEYGKVFLFLHNVHATMNTRELLYTAVTRARKDLHILCETYTFERGVKSQSIKGDTIADKAAMFRGRMIAEARAKGKQLEMEGSW